MAAGIDSTDHCVVETVDNVKCLLNIDVCNLDLKQHLGRAWYLSSVRKYTYSATQIKIYTGDTFPLFP